MPRILSLLVCLFAFVVCAEDKARLLDREKLLQTRVFLMRDDLPIDGALPLEKGRDGAERLDLLPFLRESGISAPEGSQAIWLPKEFVIVATLTPEDYDLMEQLLKVPAINPISRPLTLTLAVWECPQESVAQVPVTMMEQARQAAGDKLRLVHQQSVRTVSGQRVTGLTRFKAEISAKTPDPENASRSNPATANEASDKRRSPAEELGAGLGSFVEFEPVIGPDLLSVDMAVDYALRVPSILSGQTVETSGRIALTLFEDADTVVHSAVCPASPSPDAHNSVAAQVFIAVHARLGLAPKTPLQKLKTRLASDPAEKARWEREMIRRAQAR